jgi:hypothetical protein
MDTHARLLAELDTSRAAMRTAINPVDPAFEIYPGWTLHHLLAHITGWDAVTTQALEAVAYGSEYVIPGFKGINAYNARSVIARADLTLDQMREEWEIERVKLRTALNAVTADALEAVITLPWTQRGTPVQMVQVMIDHEHEHASELVTQHAGHRPRM